MNNVNGAKTLNRPIVKRKATRNVLTTFVAAFVFLFAFTLSSCKCCDKNKGKNDGKDNGKNNSVTDRDKNSPNAQALTDKERADFQAQIADLQTQIQNLANPLRDKINPNAQPLTDKERTDFQIQIQNLANPLTDKDRAYFQTQIQNLARYTAAVMCGLRAENEIEIGEAHKLTTQAHENVAGEFMDMFNQIKDRVKEEFAQAVRNTTTKK